MSRGNARKERALGRIRLGVALGLVVLAPGIASASRLRIRTDYGPENSRRALRPETRYIVLHTTEGREAGSLRKLRTRGEAHYFVHRDGRVVRLLDRSRIATHAGRSLWNGHSEIDELSIGIEVSGYHDRQPTRAQTAALSELLRQLQSVYGIPDANVLTHSMVAYGSPNRYHPYKHRGRKRCAMVFARPDVRRELGLSAAPADDPDVRAGRLRVGDPELQRKLYPAPDPVRRAAAAPEPEPQRPVAPREAAPAVAPPPVNAVVATPAVAGAFDTITLERTAWSIAGRAYASATTVYVFPDGTHTTGDAIRGWDAIPPGTRVVLDRAALSEMPPETEADDSPQYEDGLILLSQSAAARDLLGSAAVASTTTYIFTDGSVKTGDEMDRDRQGRRRLERLPPGTRILVGYVNAGRLTASRSLARVAGDRWNYPSTYYRLPNGSIRAGVEIEDSRLPRGTFVFFRQ